MDNEDSNIVDRTIAALGVARDAYALLPPLPPGIRPVHIGILSAMYRIGGDNTRVTDINRSLGFALPNTTRFINELVAQNVVRKSTTDSDKRVVLVRTTDLGERYTREYVVSFHERLEAELVKLGMAECEAMIENINRVHLAMQKVCQDHGTVNDE